MYHGTVIWLPDDCQLPDPKGRRKKVIDEEPKPPKLTKKRSKLIIGRTIPDMPNHRGFTKRTANRRTGL